MCSFLLDFPYGGILSRRYPLKEQQQEQQRRDHASVAWSPSLFAVFAPPVPVASVGAAGNQRVLIVVGQVASLDGDLVSYVPGVVPYAPDEAGAAA